MKVGACCMLGHQTLLTQIHLTCLKIKIKGMMVMKMVIEVTIPYMYTIKYLFIYGPAQILSYIVYEIGPLSFSDGLWFSYWLMN